MTFAFCIRFAGYAVLKLCKRLPWFKDLDTENIEQRHHSNQEEGDREASAAGEQRDDGGLNEEPLQVCGDEPGYAEVERKLHSPDRELPPVPPVRDPPVPTRDGEDDPAPCRQPSLTNTRSDPLSQEEVQFCCNLSAKNALLKCE